MMGHNPLPNMEYYWSTDLFYNNPEISKVFTLKRFKKITVNLHLNDISLAPSRHSPNYDKLYKLRPFINELNKIFQKQTANSNI